MKTTKRNLIQICLLGITLQCLLPLVAKAQFTYSLANGAATITGYDGSVGNVVIPSSINGFSVTTISRGAFENWAIITNVVVPGSVTFIAGQAFESCSKLRTLTMSEGVTMIGPEAFMACYTLTNITIPASVTNIGGYAFAFCYDLNQVHFQGNAPIVGNIAGSADSTVFSYETGTVYYKSGTTGWGSTYGGWATAVMDTTAPILKIVSPTQGQKWSNSVFTVTGTASDNKAVAEVYYSLNNASWALASTANNWSNWTAQVTLTAGTNIIKAYAVDTSGNCSSTNSANVVYIVTAPISINIVGSGTLKGAVNGQSEVVGSLITLTDTPSKGYVLTNWQVKVGGTVVLSTNMATSFVMQPNLVLTATFLDVQKPVLKVTSPKTGLKTTNGTITARGTIKDNGTGGTVRWQINSGGWNVANGWSIWSNNVPLVNGTNILQIYAQDLAGNYSGTNTLKIIHTSTGKVVSVSANLSSQQPAPLEFAGNARLSTGCFYFGFTGPTGSNVVVQASTNLQDWVCVSTNTLVSGTNYFSDPQPANYPRRFYRVRTQ